MTKAKVLYLSYDGLTDPLGQSQILPYLKGLSEEFAITVISFEKGNNYQELGRSIEEACEKFEIEWIPLTYHKTPPVFSTLYDLSLLRNTIKRLNRIHQFKIVHCRSYLTALVGLWMKRRYDVRFIFDMRGFWADERVEGKIWNLRNPLYRLVFNFFKRKEIKFLSGADHIISLTENAKSELLSWNLKTAPITVIPTCVDLDLFDPDKINAEERDAKREKLDIDKDDFVLAYLGSWGTWYRGNDVLDFFSILRENSPNAKLLIISPDLVSLQNYKFSSAVRLLKARREEVPLLLSVASALVCFIIPTFSKRASSATKVAEAWAMNLPVVTNDGWGDIEMLGKSNFPLLICNSMNNAEDVVRKLLDRPQINMHGKMDFFDLASGVEKIKKIYRSLLH